METLFNDNGVDKEFLNGLTFKVSPFPLCVPAPSNYAFRPHGSVPCITRATEHILLTCMIHDRLLNYSWSCTGPWYAMGGTSAHLHLPLMLVGAVSTHL